MLSLDRNNNGKIDQASNAQKAIYLPIKTIYSLKKEFNIIDSDVETFIAALIDKLITERVEGNNTEVFSSDEVKEIEDNLKGLGYI